MAMDFNTYKTQCTNAKSSKITKLLMIIVLLDKQSIFHGISWDIFDLSLEPNFKLYSTLCATSTTIILIQMNHRVFEDLKKDNGVDIPLLNSTFKDI